MTYVIVAYTKRMVDKFWPKSLGTDLYAVFVAFLILFMATYFLENQITWSSGLLALLNGFLVAAVSGKFNDKAVAERSLKRRLKTDIP